MKGLQGIVTCKHCNIYMYIYIYKIHTLYLYDMHRSRLGSLWTLKHCQELDMFHSNWFRILSMICCSEPIHDSRVDGSAFEEGDGAIERCSKTEGKQTKKPLLEPILRHLFGYVTRFV